MTNKLEIDRELAERMEQLLRPSANPPKICCGSYDEWESQSLIAADELRALLAAPVVERQPVAWGAKSDLAAIKDGALCSGTLWGKKNPPPLEERSPLYAEQPAPVAVVLPEPMELVAPSPDHAPVDIHNSVATGWNACLDKVKELIPTTAAASNNLRNFANAMIDIALEGGDADGGHIQELAIKHGLLKPEQRTERCGDACSCAEYADFPVECFRKVKELNQ